MPDDPFYHTGRWKKLRVKVLRRDKYLCVICKRYGKRTAATTVHHKKEREAYPELAYDMDNLESVCDAHHNKDHPDKGRLSQFKNRRKKYSDRME